MKQIFSRSEARYLFGGGVASLILAGFYVWGLYTQYTRPVLEGANWYVGHELFLYVLTKYYVAIPHLVFWGIMLVATPIMVIGKMKNYSARRVLTRPSLVFYLVSLLLFGIFYGIVETEI